MYHVQCSYTVVGFNAIPVFTDVHNQQVYTAWYATVCQHLHSKPVGQAISYIHNQDIILMMKFPDVLYSNVYLLS